MKNVKREAQVKFEINGIYKTQNGKKFKVLDRGRYEITIAPVKGCITYKKDKFSAKLSVANATGIEQAVVHSNYLRAA